MLSIKKERLFIRGKLKDLNFGETKLIHYRNIAWKLIDSNILNWAQGLLNQ